MKRIRLMAFLLSAVTIFTGCEPGGENQQNISQSISGTVDWDDSSTLGPDARLVISLQDVSRADAAAVELAELETDTFGPPPFEFELPYDARQVDERMSYAIRAQIYDGEQLAFTTDTHIPVLTRGAGNEANIQLVAVGAPAQAQIDGMALEGMFRYMADAAIFRDCRTNKTFPVSMEGEYIELERAYLNSGIDAGAEAMVRVRGRLLERPAMEGNRNTIKLIVDSFEEILPEDSCAPMTHADLIDTYWRLLEVDGTQVQTAEGRKEPHLILASAESRAHGNAGCNNYFGQYQLEDDTLTFSAMASTMMACIDGMDTEQAFLVALGKTNRYVIEGLFLELYADDVLLARFEAVYL
jgi:heat shock protein HslJ/uncharacterized lipoprotein YbaY